MMKESTKSFPFALIDVYNTCYALDFVWTQVEERGVEREQ